MFNINFADDWIWTADLWYQKRPVYQLSHNHCQWKKNIFGIQSFTDKTKELISKASFIFNNCATDFWKSDVHVK